MKRLTEKRDGVNVIPLRNAMRGVDLPRWAVTSPTVTEKFLSGDAADRLAAYEDTGLEPEELRQAGVSQAEIDRLFEIAVAESEGRLLVLPCKVGDAVYWVRGTAVLQVYVEWFETNTYGWCVCGQYPPINPTFKFDDFGKTVFLTREEAEAALRKEQENE